MLKGLQNNFDALKAYELSKTIQEGWLQAINTSAQWDLELLFEEGRPEGCCMYNKPTVKVIDKFQQIKIAPQTTKEACSKEHL